MRTKKLSVCQGEPITATVSRSSVASLAITGAFNKKSPPSERTRPIPHNINNVGELHFETSTIPGGDMSYYPFPIEQIRREEFRSLSEVTYLDHAGSQVAPSSVLFENAKDHSMNLYGNPHSDHTPSRIAGEKCDNIRNRLLTFFGADPKEYELIFTANATAAIKLAMEAVRDYSIKVGNASKLARVRSQRSCLEAPFHYYYHRDAHTSIVGVREFSRKHGCLLSEVDVQQVIRKPMTGSDPLTLLAYPGQSNMTGRRLPTSWLRDVRNSPRSATTFTLFDAAALATTSQLHISQWKPDFVALAFYKIFGTVDLGALIVHKERVGPLMQARRYFGGGTVDMVITGNRHWHRKKLDSIHAANEDGTIPFHDIICLGHCLNAMDRVYGGISNVGRHVAALTRQLYEAMISLVHYNHNGLVEFYLDEGSEYGNTLTQGGTIAFNIVRANDEYVGYQDVEKAADKAGIFLRSGALCNPGGVASLFHWTAEDMRNAYNYGHRCSKPIQGVMGRPTGVVRASLGACSSRTDIDNLVAFLKATYLEEAAPEARRAGPPFGVRARSTSLNQQFDQLPAVEVTNARHHHQHHHGTRRQSAFLHSRETPGSEAADYRMLERLDSAFVQDGAYNSPSRRNVGRIIDSYEKDSGHSKKSTAASTGSFNAIPPERQRSKRVPEPRNLAPSGILRRGVMRTEDERSAAMKASAPLESASAISQKDGLAEDERPNARMDTQQPAIRIMDPIQPPLAPVTPADPRSHLIRTGSTAKDKGEEARHDSLANPGADSSNLTLDRVPSEQAVNIKSDISPSHDVPNPSKMTWTEMMSTENIPGDVPCSIPNSSTACSTGGDAASEHKMTAPVIIDDELRKPANGWLRAKQAVKSVIQERLGRNSSTNSGNVALRAKLSRLSLKPAPTL